MVLLDAILEKAYRLVHWPPGPWQGWATGFDSSPRADNTSVRAGGVLSVGVPRFLNKSQYFTVHLFRPWRPGSARGSDGGPRRFTAVVPTPHAYSGQWPVKTKRARARNCASVVTRKRPSLNRADGPSQPNPYLKVGHDWRSRDGCLQFRRKPPGR